MATEMVVAKALNAFANNYNKTEQWVNNTQRLWVNGLVDIHDKDLVRAVELWCRNRRTLPNLARLRELIEAGPKANPKKELSGCPACDFSGWRQMARWFEMKGKTKVFTCVAACDCPKGQRFESSSVKGWREVEREWKANTFTDVVYVGTAQNPHLTTEQRLSPTQLEQLKALKAKDQPTVSGWSNLAKSNLKAGKRV